MRILGPGLNSVAAPARGAKFTSNGSKVRTAGSRSMVIPGRHHVESIRFHAECAADPVDDLVSRVQQVGQRRGIVRAPGRSPPPDELHHREERGHVLIGVLVWRVQRIEEEQRQPDDDRAREPSGRRGACCRAHRRTLVLRIPVRATSGQHDASTPYFALKYGSRVSSPEVHSAQRIVVVMPAYNAARTLRQTYDRIPPVVEKVILVDDHSQDETIAVASSLGLKVIPHPHNVGYGGNQKTCYMEALRDGADVVVMLHPDGQYDPELITSLVRPILEGRADMVLGSRFLAPGGVRASGMPVYKILGNRLLTAIENLVFGTRFSECHTGYRAYSSAFLRRVPFLRNSNDFVFDTEVIAQAVAFGQRVVEIPARTRYFSEASSVGFLVSVRYGLKTLATMATFLAWRLGFARARLFQP